MMRAFLSAMLLQLLVSVDSYNISDVQALRKHLFEDSGYDWRIRPSINQSKYTEVKFILFAALCQSQRLWSCRDVAFILWDFYPTFAMSGYPK